MTHYHYFVYDCKIIMGGGLSCFGPSGAVQADVVATVSGLIFSNSLTFLA